MSYCNAITRAGNFCKLPNNGMYNLQGTHRTVHDCLFCSKHSGFLKNDNNHEYIKNWSLIIRKYLDMGSSTDEVLEKQNYVYRMLYFFYKIFDEYIKYKYPNLEKSMYNRINTLLNVYNIPNDMKESLIFFRSNIKWTICIPIYKTCDICYKNEHKKIKMQCCNNSMCMPCWNECSDKFGKCPYCRRHIPGVIELLINAHTSYDG